MIATKTHIPTSAQLQYGLLALPIAFAGFPIYVHAPDFYASQFGLSLTSLALILLALRFFDGIQDPFIGWLSDKFSDHRISIMIGASGVLLFGFYNLFQPLTDQYYLIWFGVSLLLVTTAYSVLVINLTALGGVWSDYKHERTRIAVFRESFGLVGLVLAVVLPSVLTPVITAPVAFKVMSLLLGAFLLVSLTLFFKWYFEFGSAVEKKISSLASTDFFQTIRTIPSDMRHFFLTYGISMLASSIPAVLVIFYVRDFLGAPQFLGLFLLLYFMSGALGMMIWERISRKLDNKETTWMIAMLMAIFSFIWALFLSPGDLVAYGVICVLSGLAFGAELALPASLLADQISSHKKEAQSASLYAQMTLLAKLSLALATAVVFPLLDNVGFRPSEVNDNQSLLILVICYAAIPCLIKLIAVFLLSQRVFSQHRMKES